MLDRSGIEIDPKSPVKRLLRCAADLSRSAAISEPGSKAEAGKIALWYGVMTELGRVNPAVQRHRLEEVFAPSRPDAPPQNELLLQTARTLLRVGKISELNSFKR